MGSVPGTGTRRSCATWRRSGGSEQTPDGGGVPIPDVAGTAVAAEDPGGSVAAGEGEGDAAAPQPATTSPKTRTRAPRRIGELLPVMAEA